MSRSVVEKRRAYPLVLSERIECWYLKKAVWTGEKRPPKKGEWFLSGAIVEAYRAKADISTPMHIAKLVAGRIEWRFVAEDGEEYRV